MIKTWPGLDSEFYQLEKKLRELGFERGAGETAAHWLDRVTRRGSAADFREPLQEALALHYRHRFDPRGLGTEQRTALHQQVQACLAGFDQLKSGERGLE